MGAWGYKALESDEGLDVVDFLAGYIPNHLDLALSEIIIDMKKEGFFGESFEAIHFYFDHAAMALTELYLMYLDTGKLDYDHDISVESDIYFDVDEEDEIVFGRIKSFTANKESLNFLLRYLTDIRDCVPDADGVREIVELWKASKSWNGWKSNLELLISRIEQLMETYTN